MQDVKSRICDFYNLPKPPNPTPQDAQHLGEKVTMLLKDDRYICREEGQVSLLTGHGWTSTALSGC